jgi:hypothetical protein
MDTPSGDVWFRPKEFGYGAGLPLNWKGWALLAGLLSALLVVSYIADHTLSGWPRIGGILIADFVVGLPFVLIARAKTEGGWRRRS